MQRIDPLLGNGLVNTFQQIHNEQKKTPIAGLRTRKHAFLTTEDSVFCRCVQNGYKTGEV
jgi:hypothetical protein